MKNVAPALGAPGERIGVISVGASASARREVSVRRRGSSSSASPSPVVIPIAVSEGFSVSAVAECRVRLLGVFGGPLDAPSGPGAAMAGKWGEVAGLANTAFGAPVLRTVPDSIDPSV